MTRSNLVSGGRSVAGLAAAAALATFALVGCASGGSGGSAPDAPAAPVAPIKKPFEAPSWDSAVYSNDELGFSVHYPSDFAEQPAQDGGLFTAASPMMVPRVDVNRSDATEGATLESVIPVLVETIGQVGGGEATLKESKLTKLQDEVTPAFEAIVDWSFQGFPLQSFVVGAIQSGSVITVMVTGMQGGDVSELSTIAYTLYFD